MIVIENTKDVLSVWNPIFDGNWKFNVDRAHHYKKNKEFCDDFERKMMWGGSFKIEVKHDMFFKGDYVMLAGQKDMLEILSTPRMHYWQRFKKWMGWNYEWYYKVKKV
jgi:hypothetical protein